MNTGGEFATVLSAHTARYDDELTVNVNDKVIVTEKGEDGWWRGRLNDKEGLFPSSCVQIQHMEQTPSVSTNTVSLLPRILVTTSCTLNKRHHLFRFTNGINKYKYHPQLDMPSLSTNSLSN